MIRIEEIEGKTKKYVKAACFFRDRFGGYDSKKKLKERYLI